jgi:cellulose synthase/poly-beta-1,6-N-acetylglucosamine synthase-like glycosyltransferase
MNDSILQFAFWFFLALVFYAYVGYGFVLYLVLRVKRFFKGKLKNTYDDNFLPDVTFIVAAYNEERWIETKLENCFAFDYPKDKIHFFFVTDGSDDTTPQIIDNYPRPAGVDLQLFHKDERKGKIAAVERIMEFVKSPITIYTDANTLVNKMAIRNIVRHYADEKVGAVAGEKRIQLADKDEASSAGEGIYWKYESTLKKWDSELYSVVGAAGELFSIRTDLYEPVPSDTIIEDFFMTLRIAKRGFRVVYEPDAYAVESSSASVKEELKRKIRIAAGGLQAIYRLAPLLNPFRFGMLSFQYISHRVLRWTLAPVALPIIFILNIALALGGSPLYQLLLVAQVIFYFLAIMGYLMERQKLKFKVFFIPYYFCMMNYAVYRGFGRIVTGNQSVIWERAKRA